MYVMEFRASEAIMDGADERRPDSMTLTCDDFVQLTYNELRAGPDGETVAYFDEHADVWLMPGESLSWSDIIIHRKD